MTVKLSKEEIILRILRGAHQCGASLQEVYFALRAYFADHSKIDEQPLLGWFNLGGE